MDNCDKLLWFIHRRCKDGYIKNILTIIFVIDCIALSAIILLQEGKSAGLGNDQRSRRFILGAE